MTNQETAVSTSDDIYLEQITADQALTMLRQMAGVAQNGGLPEWTGHEALDGLVSWWLAASQAPIDRVVRHDDDEWLVEAMNLQTTFMKGYLCPRCEERHWEVRHTANDQYVCAGCWTDHDSAHEVVSRVLVEAFGDDASHEHATAVLKAIRYAESSDDRRAHHDEWRERHRRTVVRAAEPAQGDTDG